MFVNERPGRKGAGKSKRLSFDNDDPTARFFKQLFSRIGINRRDVFITNAVLCYPLVEDYKDTAPKGREIKNCTIFLRRQIELVNPQLIVTLGSRALRAIKLLFPHSIQLRKYRLKNNIGERITDITPNIYPLYHTSQRARVTRSASEQEEDWQQIAVFVDEISHSAV